MNEDRCVMCGEIIPEGRMVCPVCEHKIMQENAISNFVQPACINCHSNPKNGGDGICFCTLGQMTIY